jgi:ABC-type tungstate transport system substrate-binding protein
MSELNLPLVLEIAARTLLVCGAALALSLLLGLPVGVWLGRRRFRGRVLGISLVNAGMGAPPVVVGLVAAVIAALGGILSEVGAVLAVGGNLAGETRVLTTAVLMYTQMGEFEVALTMAAVLLGMTLMLAGLLTVVQQGGRS